MPSLIKLTDQFECTVTGTTAQLIPVGAVKNIVVEGHHDLEGQNIDVRLLSEDQNSRVIAHDSRQAEKGGIIPDCRGVFTVLAARLTLLGHVTHREAVYAGLMSRFAFIATNSEMDMTAPVTVVTLDVPEPEPYYQRHLEDNLVEDRKPSKRLEEWAIQNLRQRNQESYWDFKVN